MEGFDIMNERIRELRKKLKLNQTEFGIKIGLKQRTIADLESGKNSLTERNFESICRVFNVNAEWLRNGVGEIFKPQEKKTYLDFLIAEYGLKNEHKILIESILELPPEMWQFVIDWIKNCAVKFQMQTSENAKEKRRRELENQIRDAQKELLELNSYNFDKPDNEISREEAHALLDQELEAVQKGQEKFSAFTSISGQAKNRL